jgi:deazaflavin-dependent oxidoreductase (nitroreductase family)
VAAEGSDSYVDGRYVPERKRNVLVRSAKGGRILSAMHLPFFMALPPSGFGVVTTTGRKTGKARRKCIRTIRRDDKVYVVAIGGARNAWLKNALADPNVRLRIRGGRFAGVARELRDPYERDQAMAAFCETVSPFDYLECAVHRRGRPTRSKVKELHRRWFEGGIPLVVELEDA